MSQSTSNISPLVSRQMSIQDIQVICQPHAKRIKQQIRSTLSLARIQEK